MNKKSPSGIIKNYSIDAEQNDKQGKPQLLYSLVIPVYKNEGTISSLIECLNDINSGLSYQMEVVFVVDGSPDKSLELLRKHLVNASFASQLICLSRNFGSFSAIRMGLEAARGKYFAVMAADLQEPPELVSQFFHTLSAGKADVTIGVREKRNDPALSSLFAKTFWLAYRRLIQPEVPEDGVDVFGCNAQVRNSLLSIKESNSSLVGLLFWLGFRREFIPYVRKARTIGKSSWSFRRKFRYMLDSAFSFTDLPINLLLMAGGAGLVLSVTTSFIVLAAWIAGQNVAGYTPLMLLSGFATALIVFSLGIVGSYVWRTYENSKSRPLFIPMSHETFEGVKHVLEPVELIQDAKHKTLEPINAK